jgi:tetratricopeptide (TPR) repeat protein
MAMLLAGILAAQDLPTAGTSTTLPTAAPTMGPGLMSLDDVLQALKQKESPDQLLKDLKQRGVDFEVDAEAEKKLHKAKATDEEIKAVKDAGPKERAAAAKTAAAASGVAALSKEENADFRALEAEQDPDKAIAASENFIKKYPQSQVLDYVYVWEAYAYEKKEDAEKTLMYAQKSLELKNDNLLALLITAHVMPQHQYLSHHQSDEEQQLNKAMSYSTDAEKAVGNIKKLPEDSEADFAIRKQGYLCEIHSDRGMIHLDLAQLGLLSLDQDELAKAADEYKKAVACPAPAAEDYYRMGDAYRLMKKDDDAIAAYTKASQLGQGVLKQYADRQIAALKAGGAK